MVVWTVEELPVEVKEGGREGRTTSMYEGLTDCKGEMRGRKGDEVAKTILLPFSLFC